MLPPAEKFASRMQSLGLGDGSRIVVTCGVDRGTVYVVPTLGGRSPS